MTKEERIAAKQAKIQAMKDKMAAAAEKAKNAHTMKKAEIDAAIDSIIADLDELDAIVASDYAEYEAAVDKQIDKQIDTLNAQIDDQYATAAGEQAAAEENARLAKARRDRKINSLKLKAQMKAEVLKERIDDRRESAEEAEMDAYVLELMDYAECCQQMAFSAAVEADLILLEAASGCSEF